MKVLALLLVTSAGSMIPLRAENPVIVHEWGTFTSLQDDKGNALGGINVDDEPVPDFVWGSGTVHRPQRLTFGLPPYNDRVKGWQPADSNVTMRLETPVIYIYPPKGETPSSVPPLNVHVDFHGGLLSEYYPYAEPKGFPNDFPYNQHIDIGNLTTGLTWSVVALGTNQKPVETSDKVWTTPREVGAPMLAVNAQQFDQDLSKWTMTTQAEHFLFYRGIGHLDSPLKIDATTGKIGPLSIEAIYPGVFKSTGWLVEIRANGSSAFTELPSFSLPEKGALIPKNCRFDSRSFAAANLDLLKTSMHDALVKEGLYDDEATAMLKTWELSYFKSPGLRFFYIVPRAWVDRVLPLTIKGAPVEITRVMVGRIELISDDEKAALARLAAGPCPDLPAIKQAAWKAVAKTKLSEADRAALDSGAKPLTDLGISIPPLARDYLALGRFRDALVVHEQREHPGGALAQFIKDNGLAAAQ